MRAGLLDPARLFARPLESVVLQPLRDAGYSVDVFVITGSHECAPTVEALSSLQPREFRCIDERERTRAEARWLRHGPKTAWRREAFLGQLKKVRACAELVGAGAYQLVARGRLDVLWHRFPRDAAALEAPGVVWLPWRATENLMQYINDCFAVGRPEEMAPYLHVYDSLLNPRLWPAQRAFELSSDGLDTEELWETTLLAAGVLARQHRGICFNFLSKDLDKVRSGELVEEEDNCREVPSSVHPNGYSLDASWLRVPFKFLPGQFEHDALLTARLLHMWLGEWARLGRPVKVMEFGCGRATMLERWLQFHPASLVGVDMLPGLSEVLGDDVLQLDLSSPIFPSRLGRARGCRVVMPPEAEGSGASQVDAALLKRCCVDPKCRGVGVEQRDLGMGPEWVPEVGDVQLRPRNLSQRRTIPWSDGRADWVVALDVVDSIPPRHRRTFFDNVARFASEGAIIVSSGREEQPAPELQDSLGFQRDRGAERWLAPFATQQSRLRRVRVLRRRGRGALADAQPCHLELLKEWSAMPRRCVFGLTFGCVDGAHVWVSDGCDGWFSRGAAEAACLSDAGPGAARSPWSYSPPQWQYVECFLPEPAVPSSPPSARLSFLPSTPSLSPSTLASAPGGPPSAPSALLAAEFCGPWPRQRLKLSRDPGRGLLVSEVIQTAGSPIVPLRLAKASEVQLAEEGGAALASAVSAPAGRCLAYNAWPARGLPVRFVISELADAEGRERAAGARQGRRPRVRAAEAAVWAEAVARQFISAEEGIATMYDKIDHGSAWGNQSRVWRSIAWGQDPRDHGWEVSRVRGVASGALHQMDAFAVFMQAVRFLAEVATASAVGDGAPSRIARPDSGPASAATAVALRTHEALRRMGTAWGLRGQHILSAAGFEGIQRHQNFSLGEHRARLDADAKAHVDGSDVVAIQRGGASAGAWSLRFSQSPLGRYSYHRATFAE